VAADDAELRRRIHRQSVSIVLAVAPFAVVFGAAAARTGLTFWEAVGYSALVFGGSVQFAAVQILGDGGSVASATIAGLLLALRSLAFGIIMAPALAGPLWKRAALSQLVLDESTAIGAVQRTRRAQRYGFVVAGVGVFVVWNACTILGFVVFSGAENLITDLGLDTAGPAALLALLWPRLSSTPQRRVAIAGGLVALALTPFAPAGVPILLSMFGVAAALLPSSLRPRRVPSEPTP
jgi:predicted branched-subunit amino acid permease